MTPTEVRNLLYESLVVYRHQRHAGTEDIQTVAPIGDHDLLIIFTDDTAARAEVTVRPAAEGGTS